MMNLRFAEIEELKQKSAKIDELKVELKSITQSIKTIEQKEEERFTQLRVETDEIEDRVI